MSPHEPVLEARALGFGHTRGAPVFGDVALSIAPGELTAVVGPSGVGKSSLLRVLAGLAAPSAGEVRLHGRPLTQPDPAIGLCFQRPNLLPWRDVEQNVAFGLDFARMPRLERAARRARVDALLAAMGLSEARKLGPSALSGGMAQRTALARCLAREPAVLLLDEPFSALDEITRDELHALLRARIAEQRVAALLVTHDLDEALALADRVLLLAGTPARVADAWDVALPHPRDPASQPHAALRLAILKALRRAREATRLHRPASSAVGDDDSCATSSATPHAATS
ncbi:MAG: ABC transporter ATP-binding protein [Polyangiales bacterium]